jgi:branched-chain amino acid aminotransferase
MTEPLAYLNGRFLPQSEAHLGFHDAGFVFGATITDFCRTFHRRLFRLADHLARFRRGCEYAHIPLSLSDPELTEIAQTLIARNVQGLSANQELALVLLTTPGPIGYYLGQPGNPGEANPTLCLHTFPLPYQRYARLFREGARLVIPSIRSMPPECVDPRMKQRSRLHWWLGEREAQRLEPGSSALLLNQEGYVTETAAASFLMVRAGTVYSPPGNTILDGISLRVTRELCEQLGIPFAEALLTPAECQQADEAFLTGTAFCLAGVRSINGVGLPWPGPITAALALGWNNLVGLDFRDQILAIQ